MRAQLRGLFRLDLDAVDFHKGVTGLASILAFAIFVVAFGTIGMVAALATLFVVMADQPGPLRDRGIGILIMTVVGSIIAFVGAWAGTQHIVVAALLTFVIVALATLAAGFGSGNVVRGMLLSVWAVVAIGMAGEAEAATQMAIAFAGGGLIAAVVLWLQTRARPEPPMEAETTAAAHTAQGVIRSPLGWFALLRATAAGLALLLGGVLFPEHASWAALTVILVMKPKAGETVASGLLRTIGTLTGVIVAEAVILISGGEAIAVTIGFMIFAFGMAALHKVNYAVFVACLTGVLVLSDQLASGTGESTATDRLLATLLGAAIAFIGIAIGRVLLGRPVAGADVDQPAEDEDQAPG
jgi:hypothetical protein